MEQKKRYVIYNGKSGEEKRYLTVTGKETSDCLEASLFTCKEARKIYKEKGWVYYKI